MKPVLLIAGSNILRFARNRSFIVIAVLAPFGIMAALSSTIGSALSGEFRPQIVIADELAEEVAEETAEKVDGGAIDGLVAQLRASGFEDLEVVSSEAEARRRVDDGSAGAAIIYPAALGASLADPAAQPGTPPGPITVVADAEAEISAEVAEAIAAQSARTFDTVRALGALGAPADDLEGPIALVGSEDVESRVLTDGTYFAVGMSSYFAFFAASGFVATIHRERRESTLARMLVAPIGRFAPLAGKGLAAGAAAMLSYAVLVISSTVLLGAGWGPPLGVVAIGGALCFAAVGVSMAVVSVTRTEEAAAQIGTVLATAWAIFGGVFLEIPASGLLSSASRLSPFSWALDGIGLNAGGGTTAEVLTSAAAIAAFGVVGGGLAIARRRRLGGV